MAPVATSAAIIGGMGLLSGGVKAISGANQSKRAQRELNAYERQTLDNAFKDVSISTMGSDLLREENARTSANLVDASRQGGARSIIGAIPKIVGYTNTINQDAAKLLDEQSMRRDYAIAGDNARIENIIENRDNQNISALSSQVNAGKQDMWDGITGAMSSISQLKSTGKKPANPNPFDSMMNPGFSDSIDFQPKDWSSTSSFSPSTPYNYPKF